MRIAIIILKETKRPHEHCVSDKDLKTSLEWTLNQIGWWDLGSVTIEECNNQGLAKQIKEFLTNGWSEHERSHWKDYLEKEIKPFWPALYDFLKSAIKEN